MLLKTPIILQMEAVECGAAALAMILGYHGRFIPLEQLRIECGVSRDGSKASNIVSAARDHGMEASGHSRSLKELRTLEQPCILFWEFNHFLVFEGCKNGKYFLNDPAYGRRQLSEQEFSEGFTGITLEMTPGKSFSKLGKPYNVIHDIRKWVKGFEMPMFLLIVLGALLSVPLVLVPLFSRFYIDYILIRENREWMLLLTIAIVVTSVLTIVLEHMKKNILRRLQVKLAIKLGYVFISRLFRLPMQFFLQRDRAEVMARAELCDLTAKHIAGPVTLFFISIINLVLFTATLILFQPLLALIGIASAFVVVAVLTLIANSSVNANIRFRKERSALIGFSVNSISLIETLKATGMESENFQRWSGHFAKMQNAEFESGKFIVRSALIPVTISLFTAIAILYAGSYMVINGTITVGGLVGVIALTQCFATSLLTMADISKSFPELSASFSSLNDIFNYGESAGSGRALSKPVGDPDINAMVELKELTFGYIRRAAPTVNGINFKLHRNKSLALVGRSGSGKSTIAKVVSGLYEAWSGAVFIAGRPLHDYTASELASKLTVVEQQTRLFSGSIRFNLQMWNEKCTEEAMTEACRMAGIHEEILSKPRGYDFMLEENGRNLSGGQRQRIELARCILRKPEILILDEATSALDEETEKQVMNNILQLGITVIVIAHRLSTIRNCDDILVFDKGKIVEEGSHDSLVGARGKYFELVNTQDN
jgi:ATP-binding cassette subfamily C protein